MMFAIVGVLIMVIMLIMITSLSRIKKKTTVRIEEGEEGANGGARTQQRECTLLLTSILFDTTPHGDALSRI